MSDQTAIVRPTKTATVAGLAGYPERWSLRQILLLGIPKRKRQEKRYVYRTIRLERYF